MGVTPREWQEGYQMVLIARRTAEVDQTCTHGEATTTITAGLERSVCERCARVSVRYLYDLLEETYHISEIDLDLLSR